MLSIKLVLFRRVWLLLLYIQDLECCLKKQLTENTLSTFWNKFILLK